MNFNSYSFRNTYFKSFCKGAYNNKFSFNIFNSKTNTSRFLTVFSNKYYMTKINHMKIDSNLNSNFMALQSINCAAAQSEMACAEEGTVSLLSSSQMFTVDDFFLTKDCSYTRDGPSSDAVADSQIESYKNH